MLFLLWVMFLFFQIVMNQNKNNSMFTKTSKIFWPHCVCKFQLLLVALLLSGKKVVIRHTSKPGRCFAKMGKLLHLQILMQKKSANSTLEYYSSAKWPIKLVFVAKRFVEVSTYVKGPHESKKLLKRNSCFSHFKAFSWRSNLVCL